MSADKGQNTDNEQQLLQNLYGLVQELQQATVLATKFSTAALVNKAPEEVQTSASQAKVVELGLQALDIAARASGQIHALSEQACALSLRLRSSKELTG